MKAYLLSDKIVMLHGPGLKVAREKRELTLEDVASKCRVSRQAVFMWEEGKSSPHDDSMKMLVKLFGRDALDASGAIVIANDVKQSAKRE